MKYLKKKHENYADMHYNMYEEYENVYFSLADMFGGLGPIFFTFLIDFVLSLLTQKTITAIFALNEPESLILGAVLIVVFVAPATKVLDVIWCSIIRARMRKNHIPKSKISELLKEFAAKCGSPVDDE